MFPVLITLRVFFSFWRNVFFWYPVRMCWWKLVSGLFEPEPRAVTTYLCTTYCINWRWTVVNFLFPHISRSCLMSWRGPLSCSLRAQLCWRSNSQEFKQFCAPGCCEACRIFCINAGRASRWAASHKSHSSQADLLASQKAVHLLVRAIYSCRCSQPFGLRRQLWMQSNSPLQSREHLKYSGNIAQVTVHIQTQPWFYAESVVATHS